MDVFFKAVDFLEQREKQQGSKEETGNPQSSDATPIPRGSSFNNAPRRVSSDSVVVAEANTQQNRVACMDAAQAIAACQQLQPKPMSPPVVKADPTLELFSTNNPPTQVVEGVPPHLVSEMVAKLADDSDFGGPPPPPPPSTDEIDEVVENDVLCGRGGETNHHHGNVVYRSLVKKYQPLYIMSKRRDKPLIASKIVRIVRHSGGRFLRRDKHIWRDVGNTKAREKTSQALREGAPDLRGPAKPNSVSSHAQGEISTTATHPLVPLSRVLGVRKQPGYSGPHPHYVEARPGDSPLGNYPLAKKSRVDVPVPVQVLGEMSHLYGSAGAAQNHTPYTGTNELAPTKAENLVVGTPLSATAVPLPASVSPHSFGSNDDEDSKSSRESSNENSKPRGPRLKLLKKRLQESQD